MRLVAGAFCALFAVALFVLPLMRVLQKALPLNGVIGLWLAAGGFALLSLAAFDLIGDATSACVLGGAALAVVGNSVQRRLGDRTAGGPA